MRLLVAAAAALATLAAACSAGDGAPDVAAPPPETGDATLLLERMESVHPDLFHALSRARLEAEARAVDAAAARLDRDERLVALMRLAALPGERDGHTGIFPLDRHERTLHLYPLRLYDFSDGLHVVAAPERPELVGSRLVAVDGVPMERIVRAVAPLVPRDNAMSLRARLPQYAVTAEVLHGLGLLERAGAATFTLETGDGTRDVALEPQPAERYADAFPDLFDPLVPQGLPGRPEPLSLAQRGRARSVALLDGGRALYAGYNVTLGDTTRFAATLLARARALDVERVVLDLRHNPGGENGTYPPVLEALGRPAIDRPGRLVVLIGRTTFSAASQLAAEIERTTGATFVGEPSGGSPNHYGDPVTILLPGAGLTARAADVYWETGEPGEERLAVEPDVAVALSSRDFLAGRDPVLEAATSR